MRETEEQIQLALDIAGEDLTFAGAAIKGIPGSLVYHVQNFDSPHDIDIQEFDFQVSNNDFTSNNLIVGNSFTYLLNAKTYTFKIIKTIDDLTGWFQLDTTLTGVV